jgi:glycosyltransferase involved in cell wall biosynthesis
VVRVYYELKTEAIQKLGISHLISQRKVNDSELKRFYSECFVFVYPSKYEGFGILYSYLPVIAPLCSVIL